MKSSPLDDMIAAQQKGTACGITSICSANPAVLKASFAHAQANHVPLLIESTCNQVNQYGGYTGQTAADFMAGLRVLADEHRLRLGKLMVGGDHLGPNPWRHESAAAAMDKARVLVRDYVRAGYRKIHLDTSMNCVDDQPGALPTAVIAQRSADLALVAEETRRENGQVPAPLLYVIGTEVPAPGGVNEEEEGAPQITSVESVEETISTTREAFRGRGLEAAWDRVIAVVVQPGVEYGNERLFAYESTAAAHLSRYIEGGRRSCI